jgi:hypothetical protein
MKREAGTGLTAAAVIAAAIGFTSNQSKPAAQISPPQTMLRPAYPPAVTAHKKEGPQLVESGGPRQKGSSTSYLSLSDVDDSLPSLFGWRKF